MFNIKRPVDLTIKKEKKLNKATKGQNRNAGTSGLWGTDTQSPTQEVKTEDSEFHPIGFRTHTIKQRKVVVLIRQKQQKTNETKNLRSGPIFSVKKGLKSKCYLD